MKYIAKFYAQTMVILFIFLPIIIARGIWTFKFHDKFKAYPQGIFTIYARCWKTLVRRVQGKPVFQTF